MRSFISKVVTGSMIASAALLVSACGETTETTTDNTVVTDLNTTDPMMDGTMTDNMTAVDGAMMGNDAMMMNDTMMSNDMMMSNDSMMSNDTMSNAM
ncbi:hypothetical protein OKW76_14325 [Sphingomonas sp. S1-29]|uniref:Pentapeptide MXKDX repeat protein n=1 Tax=Sphingomonas qomolangmaensis TaxID=2918765 RepID=A0ABY5L6X4_9SPHN|nr:MULTISPECIES: hypothetical protein [Sphingomonas]UUL82705.1 hypothetical protein NMP03_00170 [Sphingomonas qomolangmaensis]UZK69182.1 hypothetical protein OKW76_14325 [Sphingomonas sp. S1-29]